ncbi:hypothetical protein [Allorhizobium ampelinum]|nr:hypothetical protein [Allorhizobium ampelinum]
MVEQDVGAKLADFKQNTSFICEEIGLHRLVAGCAADYFQRN